MRLSAWSARSQMSASPPPTLPRPTTAICISCPFPVRDVHAHLTRAGRSGPRARSDALPVGGHHYAVVVEREPVADRRQPRQRFRVVPDDVFVAPVADDDVVVGRRALVRALGVGTARAE